MKRLSKMDRISAAARSLQLALEAEHGEGWVSVGHNLKDLITIYEHARATGRIGNKPVTIWHGYEVKTKYVGKIKPATKIGG